jgi:hypothetical protein
MVDVNPLDGYDAIWKDGRWHLAPRRGACSPLDQILKDISDALDVHFYYLAIMMSLALPDICASLETQDGNTRGRAAQAYKAWFQANLASKFSSLTADDTYQLRCGVVHQGHFGDNPNRAYDRIIFIGRNSSFSLHERIITINSNVVLGGIGVEELRVCGRVLHLEAVPFCMTIMDAVRLWFTSKTRDPNVQKNLPNLVRFRPEGMPPYMVGIPIIA